MKKLAGIIVIVALFSCSNTAEENDLVQSLRNYLEAKAEGDNSHYQFMADTVRTWFDVKEGEGNVQLRNQPSSGAWAGWDKEMNAYSVYDSLIADVNSSSVSGIFTEHNDFYDLIGKKEGTKSKRTYWLNESGQVMEILIEWLPSNTSTDTYLEPIVEWAIKNDSMEINYLYKDSVIIPSIENAKRWRTLLEKYNLEVGNQKIE